MTKKVSKGIKKIVEILDDVLIEEINQIFAMAENLSAGQFQQFSCDCMTADVVAIKEDDSITLYLADEVFAMMMKKSA